MSLIKSIRAQLGLSAEPANNFTLDASAGDGTMKLARGNAGATTQDIITVNSNGKLDLPLLLSVLGDPLFENIGGGSSNGMKFSNGLLIYYGAIVVSSTTAWSGADPAYTQVNSLANFPTPYISSPTLVAMCSDSAVSGRQHVC